MDKSKVLGQLQRNPEIPKLVAQLKADQTPEAAEALLSKIWGELTLMRKADPSLDPLICEVWNSVQDLKSGKKSPDDFLI